MPYYLYAPVAGSANMCPYPLERYCPGLNGPGANCNPPGAMHTRILGVSPMDIIVGYAAQVHLYVSQAIRSATVVHYSNGCAAPNQSSSSRFGVSVHLYTGLNGTGSYIGTAIFFHLTQSSRKPQGTYNLTQRTFWPPYYSYLLNLGTLAQPVDSCSTAYHPHCEHLGASGGSELQCPDAVVAAATWLYKWG